MFNILKRKRDKTASQASVEPKPGALSKLSDRLKKTRNQFGSGVANLLLGKKKIDGAVLEELETLLLTADVGVATTQTIIKNLTERVKRKALHDTDALYAALKQQLQDILAPCSKPLALDGTQQPFVILMVGVNGAGKTTTIGKLAKRLQQQGKSVMLAAGDTFRAAAVEQLQAWGERNQIPVIAQKTGADSASVIYDALQSAQARNIDVLIADTAGRLHTQTNLMQELSKIKRVIGNLDETAPHETMLVVDGGMGQNAIAQAKQFNEAVKLNGITITKLDGTAKGGTVFAIAKQFGLPIRFIGVGEKIEDLREFDPQAFVEALFSSEDSGQWTEDS